MRSKFTVKMAERHDSRQVLELLFADDFELSDSDGSDDEDAGECSYLGDKRLEYPDLENLREAVDYEQVVKPSVEIPSVNDSESSSTFDGCNNEDCEEQQHQEELEGR